MRICCCFELICVEKFLNKLQIKKSLIISVMYIVNIIYVNLWYCKDSEDKLVPEVIYISGLSYTMVLYSGYLMVYILFLDVLC